MPRTPLVAVTMTRDIASDNGVPIHMSPEAYSRALTSSGIVPLLIPSTISLDALRAIYERVDGILLSGGGDVDPSCMGIVGEAASLAIEIDEARDGTEIQLARWASEEDKPLLGICRGHQVMNVALGGTLIIDIPSSIGTQITHRVNGTPEWRSKFLHNVEVPPHSRLSTILGSGEIPVNSIHHQAIHQVAATLQVTALAPDGVIEAVENPDARFFLGVQWHPEELATMKSLFDAFASVMQ